ncbi:MAG: DUF2281 domain-containing protein [Leptolyngbyaceae cyanobacterium SM1_3_5]|nr:DUF2281 domain-containing protein [Leptolyngbyaceae cyanobacterium SM1_3_5]
MNIAEQVYAIAKLLPQKQASEILSFAKLTHTKYQSSDQSVGTEDQLPWAKLVYSLAGAWEDFPSLEEIRAEAG